MEIIKEIEKEHYPSIVIVTANNSNETKMRSLASGAVDFLVKPFCGEEVLLRVKTHVQ